MSAPHDETHEMHNEVATVARAMLSAGLAVADARRQRQLRAARDAERALSGRSRTEPAADRASSPAPERALDTAATGQQQTEQSRPDGTVPDPAGFSRRDIQQRADTMATTPGSGEHDARLRDVVSVAVPATAQAVLTDPAWPALRAGLRHIENKGGDPRAELAAAASRRPLRGADSAARVLRWRLATRSTEQDRANGTAAAPADTRDRDAGSVLRALAEDPVGTAAAYADAEAHRDTNPVAAQAWDEALRAENIDPQRVRDDAAAHRDSASTDHPGTDRDLDTVGDSSRDGFAEDYLSALARDGVDPDTARTQLRKGRHHRTPRGGTITCSAAHHVLRRCGRGPPGGLVASAQRRRTTRDPHTRRAGNTGRPRTRKRPDPAPRPLTVSAQHGCATVDGFLSP